MAFTAIFAALARRVLAHAWRQCDAASAHITVTTIVSGHPVLEIYPPTIVS